MEIEHRSKIGIILGDSKNQNRQVLRSALTHEGFRTVRDFGRMTMIREALNEMQPDLLICDAAMPEGDPCKLVEELRHSVVGMNPFLPVIFFTFSADPDLVRKAVNSGADDLLVAPISPAKLFSRIDVLIRNRKPFVVTSDYLGPDRRKDSAPRESPCRPSPLMLYEGIG